MPQIVCCTARTKSNAGGSTHSLLPSKSYAKEYTALRPLWIRCSFQMLVNLWQSSFNSKETSLCIGHVLLYSIVIRMVFLRDFASKVSSSRFTNRNERIPNSLMSTLSSFYYYFQKLIR